MSADGRAKLMQREGVRTEAYQDTKGIWTIGVGHTAAAGAPIPHPGMKITRAQVDEILQRDLPHYEGIVNRNVRVPLTQGQFDALCSICFNIEAALGPKSTIVKRLNAGDYRGAANAIMLYNKPPEIRGRREGERQQFVRATYARIADQKRGEGEGAAAKLTPADLRAAGSRTMDGTSQIKTGLAGVGTTVAGSGVVEALNQASDTVQTAQSVASNVQTIHEATKSAPTVLGWLHDYWPHLLIGVNVILAIACVYFVWRIYAGARHVERAKVDDANRDLGLDASDGSAIDEEATEGEGAGEDSAAAPAPPTIPPPPGQQH
jgi:GH24 family phage-related lysozyme (muramidase)